MSDARARAWIEVDTSALSRNAAAIASHSGTRLIPMVKADAYGVGVGPAVRALEPFDPLAYGVATVAEGEELRGLGIRRKVIVFTPLDARDLDGARDAGLEPALGDARSIEVWRSSGLAWHLAVDTGMNRAGVHWRQIAELVPAAAVNPPASVFTHFHSAELDDGTMEEQERRFDELLRSLPWRPMATHCDNSAAVARRGRSGREAIRPGIFLYGAGVTPLHRFHPQPVVSIKARIVDVRTVAAGETVSYGATHRAVRETRVATASIGHADGYPLAMSGKGRAIVNGTTVGVVGRVTMDMTMLDVSAARCAPGDEAVFVGDVLTVDDVAATGSVSPYELLVRLRNRLPRFYGP